MELMYGILIKPENPEEVIRDMGIENILPEGNANIESKVFSLYISEKISDKQWYSFYDRTSHEETVPYYVYRNFRLNFEFLKTGLSLKFKELTKRK